MSLVPLARRVVRWFGFSECLPVDVPEEGMTLEFFDVGSTDTLCWLFLQQARNQVLGMWVHIRFDMSDLRVLPDVLECLQWRMAFKWSASIEQLVENHTE